MNKLVSIIVPVYNSQRYIKKCMDSLLKQTYKTFEIICIDDGSQDDSLIILQEYRLRDARVKVINKENGGVSSARNLGIANAKGEYLLFVDADDYVADSYVESMIRETVLDNEIIVICDVLKNGKSCVGEKMDGKNIILDKQSIIKGICNNTFSGFPVNKLFKREIILSNKIEFDENIRLCEDLLFCLEYMQFVESGIYINRPLYFYDVHNDSVTSKSGYDGALLTALNAYDKIRSMEIVNSNEEICVSVRNEYFIMCIRNLKMIENYDKGNREKLYEIWKRFSEFDLWNILKMKRVSCKYKAFYLFNSILFKWSIRES